MLYISVFIIAVLVIVAMSVFFKPIGSLIIKFFNYLKNIFEEEVEDGKKI